MKIHKSSLLPCSALIGAFACAQLVAACTRELPVVDDEPAAMPDHVVFDVAWKPSTLVVQDSTSMGASLSPDGAVLEVPQPSAEMQRLVVGNQLLLSDIGLFQIMKITPDASGMRFDVAPGSLLDAADRGSISWDLGLHNKPLVAAPLPNSDPGWIVDKSDPVEFDFEGKLGEIEGSLKMKTMDNQTSIAMGVKLPTTIPFEFSASAIMTSARTDGIYEFDNGEVKEYRQSINGVTIEADYSLAGGGQGFDQTLEFPVGLFLPIKIGLLPAFVGISGKVTLRSTTTANDQGKFVSKFRISGSTGLELENGQWSGGDSLVVGMFVTPETSYNTVFTSAISAAVELPRFTVGVGINILPKPALPTPKGVINRLAVEAPNTSAGIYMALKAETVQNVAIEVQNGTKKHCRFIDDNAELNVGGEIKAFGISLSQEKQLWFGAGDHTKDGPDCDVVKKP